jgi:hypothetical protein
MIIKCPSWQKDGGYLYIDGIQEIDGPHVVHQGDALRDSSNNELIGNNLNGTLFIMSLTEGGVGSILYYTLRREAEASIRHGLVFSDRLYLMNDEGKTVETLYH